MECPVRIRVEFDDRRLLAKPQRSEGMKRCWILLNPELSTIADLSTYLTHIFSLHRTCPHGVVLSMDDFVLPLFESTCILKDKDIVRVKKRVSHVKEVIKNGDDAYFIQQTEAVQKPPVVSINKLLATEQFREDSLGCKSIDEGIICTLDENTTHVESPIGEMAKLKRRRGNSDILPSSKRKKAKETGTEKPDCNGQVAGKYSKKEQSYSPLAVATHRNSDNNDKPLKQCDRSDILLASQGDESGKKTPGSVSREKRRKKVKETGTEKPDCNGQVAGNYSKKKKQSYSPLAVATHRNSDNNDKPLKQRDRLDILLSSQGDESGKKTPVSVSREKRRKKAKETGTEKPDCNGQVAGNYSRKKKQSYSLMAVATHRNSDNNDKPLEQGDRSDILLASQGDESAKKTPGSVSRKESDDRDEENVRIDACEPHADSVKKKDPSRSARRKKAKRKLRKEMLISQNKEHINSAVPTNDTAKNSLEHQQKDLNNEAGDETVPIMVRPGYIRFESADVEFLEQQTYRPMETMQWNGTTSKKKGQKWGMEKTSKWADDNACRGESIQKHIAGDGQLADKHVNYESLPPISRLPQVGDVIAYRMVELSSTWWCPELSSFRVGKVQSYDSISLRIVLVPVPEYPNFMTEKEPDSMEPNVSSYKEDGSLDTDYPSLVDVRLFKANTSEETSADSFRRETVGAVSASILGLTSACNNITQTVASGIATPVNNWDLALANSVNTRKAEAPIANVALANSSLGKGNATCTERVALHGGTPVNNRELALANISLEGKAATPNDKRPGAGWEQINQAMNQKKAELSVKDGWSDWTPSKDKTTPPWSYRALRRSAIGPTVAFLRSKNRRF